jgi:hypothetical protein
MAAALKDLEHRTAFTPILLPDAEYPVFFLIICRDRGSGPDVIDRIQRL